MNAARRPVWPLALPPLMAASVAAIALNPAWHGTRSSAVYAAVAIDLAVSIPLVWVFVAHVRGWSKWTAVPVAIAGVVAASWLVPDAHAAPLRALERFGLPALELTALTLVVLRVRRIRRAYAGRGGDFVDALREACAESLPPRVAAVLATEVALLRYAFAPGRRPPPRDDAFTYHRTNGLPAILVALLGVLVVEITAVHFLLQMWSETAAWIASALGVYGFLQILGTLRAVSRRPVVVSPDRIAIRFGLLGDADLRPDDVERIDAERDLPKSGTRRLTLGAHNTVLHLKRDIVVRGPYGFDRPARRIAVWLDDPEGFVKTVRPAAG